jgi:hypothetical protein
MRDNWISNRVFGSAGALVDHLLRRLEQIGKSALDNHVHRHATLGVPVLSGSPGIRCSPRFATK